MPDRAYTDAELDLAITAITDPARLRDAQDLVLRTAPALQRALTAALADGGWFDRGHEQAVRDAIGREDLGERVREVRTLLAEETRLGMLVGVAVGFELARELAAAPGLQDMTSEPAPAASQDSTNEPAPAALRDNTNEPAPTNSNEED